MTPFEISKLPILFQHLGEMASPHAVISVSEERISRISASLLSIFYLSHSASVSLFVFLPKSRCWGFQKHTCLFFGSLDFVDFDTVLISSSLMSLPRDSKGKLAIPASPDRRLVSNSLL